MLPSSVWFEFQPKRKTLQLSVDGVINNLDLHYINCSLRICLLHYYGKYTLKASQSCLYRRTALPIQHIGPLHRAATVNTKANSPNETIVVQLIFGLCLATVGALCMYYQSVKCMIAHSIIDILTRVYPQEKFSFVQDMWK